MAVVVFQCLYAVVLWGCGSSLETLSMSFALKEEGHYLSPVQTQGSADVLLGAASRSAHTGDKPQGYTSDHVWASGGGVHSGSGTPRTQQTQLTPNPTQWVGVCEEKHRDGFLLPTCPPFLEALGDQLFQSQR